MAGYRIVLAAVAAVMLVAVAPEASGGGGTPITLCGQTVTTNAVLLLDLACTGDGVVVGAAGIKIDLGGHSIQGDGVTEDVGVDVAGFSNITVSNGVLRNFNTGVYSNGASHMTVSKIIATGSNYGIWAVGGESVSISSSVTSGNGTGVFIQQATPSVKSLNSSGNTFEGLQIQGQGLKVASSTISGNGRNGINASGDFGSIKSTVVSGNGAIGISYFFQAEAVQLKGNKVWGNGFAPSDLAGLGISVQYTTVPPIGKNTVRGNDDPAECSPVFIC
jgi:nitrous oxidase accessory protein NosD